MLISMSACDGPRPSPVSPLASRQRLVERRHPAAGLLELRAQLLEGGAIVLLERRQTLQHLRRERRAGIELGLLDQPLQRITDLLGVVDGRRDRLLGRMVFSSSVIVPLPPPACR